MRVGPRRFAGRKCLRQKERRRRRPPLLQAASQGREGSAGAQPPDVRPPARRCRPRALPGPQEMARPPAAPGEDRREPHARSEARDSGFAPHVLRGAGSQLPDASDGQTDGGRPHAVPHRPRAPPHDRKAGAARRAQAGRRGGECARHHTDRGPADARADPQPAHRDAAAAARSLRVPPGREAGRSDRGLARGHPPGSLRDGPSRSSGAKSS